MNASLFTNFTGLARFAGFNANSDPPTWAKGVCTRGSLIALLLSGCGNGVSQDADSASLAPETTSLTTGPVAATSTSVLTAVAPTSAIFIDSQATASEFCQQATVEHPIFENLAVGVQFPSFALTNVFYSWTTPEQAAELAASGPLLSRTERPGKGPGYALEYLASFAAEGPEQQLIELLLSEPFAKVRYAWPHAWATRMGWPATQDAAAENYGNQLLRMTVKAEALWAVATGGQLYVIDANGTVVPTSDALTRSERIVGLYFEKDANAGGASCGTFGQQSDSGFREFILMNPAMIESWSLGTDQIRDVVNGDLDRLRRFFQAVRSCPITLTEAQWTGDVICSGWNRSPTEIGAYEMTLALMNAYYIPRPAEIAAVIATLEADLETWDVVIAETTVTSGTIPTGEPDSTQPPTTTTAGTETTSTAPDTSTALETTTATETGASSL